MRILIYGINYSPEKIGIGKYTGEMAEWLASRGYEIRVVAAPPYYPDWVVQPPYRWWQYKRETVAGVTVIRCPVWVPRRPSGASRILHLASFAISSLPVCLALASWRPQVVLAIEPPFFGVAVAAIAGTAARAKLWLHIQDFELDAAKGLGLVKAQGLMRLAERFERWLMRRFDRVSSISEAMVERLSCKGVNVERRRLFPNWVDCKAVMPLTLEQSLRKEWGISPQAKVVLYAGNIGRKQGVEILLDVAKRFTHCQTDILFVVVGEGAAREELERSSRQRRLENIVFMPLQPAEKLAPMLATADVHLILQKRGASDLVMPSKLTGILAAGGVALVTADIGTELHRIVDGLQLGLVVEPESVESIYEGILHLLSDARLCEVLRSNARRYAEQQLEKSVVLTEFETQLLSLAGNPKSE